VLHFDWNGLAHTILALVVFQVVVATVGRFWELFQKNEPHVKDFTQLRFLVIDEADR